MMVMVMVMDLKKQTHIFLRSRPNLITKKSSTPESETVTQDATTWPEIIYEKVRDLLIQGTPPKFTTEAFPQNENGRECAKVHCQMELANGGFISSS